MTDITTNYKKWLKERNKPRYCLLCQKKLERISIGGGDILSIGTDAYYCKNKKCDHFGVITIAYTPGKKS